MLYRYWTVGIASHMFGNLEIGEYIYCCVELSTILWGVWGNGDIAPLILNLRARWRNALNTELIRAYNGFGRWENSNISCLCWDSNPKSSDLQTLAARIPTELPRATVVSKKVRFVKGTYVNIGGCDGGKCISHTFYFFLGGTVQLLIFSWNTTFRNPVLLLSSGKEGT